MHEDEVDVARVVQLAAAELAEPDHRHPEVADRQPARRLQARLGDARDLLDDVLQRRAVQVARGHAQHRATTEHAETVVGAEARDVAGQLRIECRADPRSDVGERRDLLRMADQEVRRGGREPQQPGRDREHLRTGELLARDGVVADPGDGHACELGIGRLRERSTEHLRSRHPGIVDAGRRHLVDLLRRRNRGVAVDTYGERVALSAEADYVLRTIEERGIRFIRLWFTDVLGFLKSFTITSQELEGAFTEGMGFDGSSIEGFSRIQESDMIAVPDPATFQLIPWQTEQTVARMFCDIYDPDGTPFDGDPRGVLKRQLQRASDLGFTFYVGPELEFFYFKNVDDPRPLDEGGYFDVTPLDVATDYRKRHGAVPGGDGHPGRVRRTTKSRRASTRSTSATATRSPWPTTS